MSRGAPPSNSTGPRGSSKGGTNPKRGAVPPEDTSPRGTSSGGGNPLRPADVTSDPNGPGPLPPDKPQAKQDPFNMSLTSLIETRPSSGFKPVGFGDAAGFHLSVPMLDVGTKQTAQDLITGLYGLKQSDMYALQQKLIDANYLDPKYKSGAADAATVNAYQLLLQDVYRYQQNPDTKDMTIDQLLAQRAEGYKAGKGQSVTTKTIQQFSPLQAQSFLEGAAEKYLGRRPNQAELADFSAKLNAYQQANPDVVTRATDQNGNVTSEADKTGITALHGGDQSAENYVMQTDPTEAKGYAGDNALMAIMSHLGLPQ
jgi:hypothetical protein